MCAHSTGLSGDKFQFDENHDGPPRYDMIHFKRDSKGRHRWERIGEYVGGQVPILKFNMSGMFYWSLGANPVRV